MSFLPTGFKRPTGFGGLSGVLSGQRILTAIPRLKANPMLMAKFMPDTMSLINTLDVKLSGAAEALTPLCLSVGMPKSMGIPAMPTGAPVSFGGLSVPSTRYTIWGLFDPVTGEPMMYAQIKEYSTMVATAQVKFLSAEFAKAKSDSMSLAIFAGDTKAVATTFPTEAGHALFTWQLT